MNEKGYSLKSIDLLMGVRSEQSLRDALREHHEAHSDELALELCPVGSKDWVAGERLGPCIKFRELAEAQRKLLGKLNGLGSHQRIRSENLRLFSVRLQVPVFRDGHEAPLDKIEEATPARTSEDTVICPVCRAEVHRYNIQSDPGGNPVGCYLCRGDARRRR